MRYLMMAVVMMFGAAFAADCSVPTVKQDKNVLTITLKVDVTKELMAAKKAVAAAKILSPGIRPIMVGGEEKYVCIIHPYQHYQLRQQTGTAQYMDIQKAAIQGGQISKNPVYTGAIAEYSGVILHESTRVPWSNASTTKGSGTANVALIGRLEKPPAGVSQVGDGIERNIRHGLSEHDMERQKIVARRAWISNCAGELIGCGDGKARTLKAHVDGCIALGHRPRRGVRQDLPELVILEEIAGIGLRRRHRARPRIGTSGSRRKIGVY